jgi:hypothetical protein
VVRDPNKIKRKSIEMTVELTNLGRSNFYYTLMVGVMNRNPSFPCDGEGDEERTKE